MVRKRVAALLFAALTLGAVAVLLTQVASARGHRSGREEKSLWHDSMRFSGWAPAATPIKHLVVIFQENVSFDHYFAAYPYATNPPGEPAFYPSPRTPSVNGLSGALLTNNPNLSNPQRLDRDQAITCDQDHDYTAEQDAFDHGLMDAFVQNTGSGLPVAACLASASNTVAKPNPNDSGYAVMDYFDGNTVTGLWNYAQHFAMSDNSYGTNFGPSTPGAINVTSGNTFGALCGPSSAVINAPPCTDAPGSDTNTGFSGLSRPRHDVQRRRPELRQMLGDSGRRLRGRHDSDGGQNIGDLLDQAGITWGWFQGGFEYPGYVPGHYDPSQASKDCTGYHYNYLGQKVDDYSPHHEPFQYYQSTANPQHLPPTSIAMIGHQDQANHQYDIADFWAAADSGNLPAVSYLKAPKVGDGHAGGNYSDPLDEQQFLVDTVNRLEKLPSWSSTAVIIAYDDSDGWYDHQIGPIVTQSQNSLDTLTAPGHCGASSSKVPMSDAGAPEQARCGVSPRLPLLVISPYAKRNFVDGTFTDQTSIVRFIEDNWLGGERLGNGAQDANAGSLDNMFDFQRGHNRPLFLDPSTGEPTYEEGRWGRADANNESATRRGGVRRPFVCRVEATWSMLRSSTS